MALYVGEVAVDDQFRSDRTGPQLGMREIQVVLALGNVVGELVRDAEPDAPGLAGPVDQISTRDLRLLSAIARVPRDVERIAVRAEDGAGPLIEPFRRHADLALCGSAAFEA